MDNDKARPIALDEIITQLMENSNSGRPVPATDEIIAKLPRELLLLGCKRITASCAFYLIYSLLHSGTIGKRLCRVQGAIHDRRRGYSRSSRCYTAL